MSKIVKSMWINTMQGCIGIVLTDNGIEKKAYIKQVEGFDEKIDSEDVASSGGKIVLSQVEALFNHLK